MDATVHAQFCTPFRQRSNHATKPGDEGGIPPRPMLLSSKSHSARLDNSNESCNHDNTAMNVLPAKVDTFTTFVPRKFYFPCEFTNLCIDLIYSLTSLTKDTVDALQRSESLNDGQKNLSKIVPISASQSMVISCDSSESFLFENITPYVQQATAASETPSELIQPPISPLSHSINSSLAANQALPLPHCSFSVPTVVNTTTDILPNGSYCDCAANDSFSENRHSLLVKEVFQEGHCCENAPHRLRHNTTDEPSPGLRSTYGRPAWHVGSKQSMLSYSSHGISRFYTKPAPSLPLLPLRQAYGRSTPRRLMLNNFPESHGDITKATVIISKYYLLSCEAESFGESACNIFSRFRSSNEGNEQAYNSRYMGNMLSGATSSITESTYSGANITYTAAGTAPPPKTFRGDPDQVVICSSTTSGRTLTYPYPLKSTYTYAECDNHVRTSPREGICKPSMHSSNKYSKRKYSTYFVRSATDAVSKFLMNFVALSSRLESDQ
ncbi:hypothetical protein X798_00313 [Onchocerca flexuosa]|uniref:Uncharacterized protein n=1 Tax=Onchocerca flexuosa TaxID=387005 RepID=A0A238C5F0_9BILA|nr:hypothetical protein X798_00313 [Onchocerca flexuosa]